MKDFIIKVSFITKKKFHTSSSIPLKIIADKPLIEIKNSNGQNVKLIPASTIKGVLRTSMIRVSKALGYKNVLSSIHPEKIRKHMDIVTTIFGKPCEDTSKISIENAYYVGETYALTHIRINDDSGVIEEGGLYSVEYVPEGKKFSTIIKCKDFSIEEARILLVALLNLRYESIGQNSFTYIKIEKIVPDEIIEELKKDEIAKMLIKILMEDDKHEDF